ncbi:MAG: amidohydrolase family protein, partial [bacterium]|nr:amidohydrolase family protein [bacterium]
MPTMRERIRIIDVDTHLTEPHDLWSSRAPAGYADRLPRVADVDGRPYWILDGEQLGFATASGVVRPDGTKVSGTDFMGWTIDDVHPGAYDMDARVEVMDRIGVHAQIIYPNLAGFGSQKFGQVKDAELKRLCVSVYNDAMAEIQENSGERLFPMGLIPWWDIEGSLAEAERIVGLGLRGLVMCSDPQLRGLPDLGEEAWRPLWELCCDHELPVNFHIGASESSMGWFGTSPWPSQGDDQKLALGAALLYLTNARAHDHVHVRGVQ